MPSAVEYSPGAIPARSLIDALAKLAAPDEEMQLITNLRQLVQGLRADLEKLRVDLDRWLAEVARVAKAASDSRKAAAEQIHTQLERLRENRSKELYSASVIVYLDEVAGIAQSALDVIEEFERAVLDLQTWQHAADSNPLRARPVTGEIDYGELSREHIARYPKIRARLAE
jgi:hypothetical protein